MSAQPTAFDATLPADLRGVVEREVERARTEDVARRVWDKDPALWGGTAETPELADRLGWLDIAGRMADQLEDLEAFAHELADEGFTDAVLLGMGGSSLAPEVLARSFGPRDGALRLHVLDSTDADAVGDVAAITDPDTTVYVVSTKSGGTIETRSLAEHFWARKPDGGHFVAITDPGSSLEDLARERGFRRTFLSDPDIGGRYSALSPFGVVPAALMGAPLQQLLDGAATAEDVCRSDDPASNSGVWLGAALGALAREGRDKLTFVVDPSIATLGLWLEQLIAESTGKAGTGILPVADEPLGTPDQYGGDRVFAYLRGGADLDGPVAALAGAGHPVVTLPVEGPADLGRIFFFAEFATAVAGWSLQINPFDQPNVQEAKDNTSRALQEGAEEPYADAEALRALVGDATPPDYVAIMAYTAPREDVDAAAAELREAIRVRTKATTTFGYGPRFLHSTGQYHKGGRPTGRFLQLVHDAAEDADIPGREFGFETLKHAQATGDLRTLRDHGLPAERVKLEGDPAAAIRKLAEELL